MQARARRGWRWAAGAAAVGGVLLLAGCCCRTPIELGPPHRLPLPAQVAVAAPAAVTVPDTVSQASMRNIDLHLDDDLHLHVRQLDGRMHDLRHTGIINLDDKRTLLLEISSGVVSMTAGDLTILLNRYVFGYRDAPLRDLRVRMQGGQMVLAGVMHNVVDLPFELTSRVSLTPEGKILVHPTAMRICGVDGFGLLRMLHVQMESLLDLSGATGVQARGNDMILDPFIILPPPRMTGRLSQVRIEGDQMVQVFGDGDVTATPPVAAPNFLHFRGGTISFGRLFMVSAELEAIDGDASDPFDFYLDHYRAQLVGGYQLSTPEGGMVAYLPDFADLGTPRGNLRP